MAEPSSRFFEFLENASDNNFGDKFAKDPTSIMDSYGLIAAERIAIMKAGRSKAEDRETQMDAIRSMFESLSLNPDEHKELVAKIVDHFDGIW